MPDGSVTLCFAILDQDMVATVEYRVTSWGHSGTAPSLSYPGDPPEPPEWEVVSLDLRVDVPAVQDPPALACPDWLRGVIEESEELADKICEQISHDEMEDYDEPDYD